MTGRSHDLAAFTALTIVFVSLPEIPTMTLATAIAAFSANFIGGLFPDIDQPTSDLWDNFRLGPYVGRVVTRIFGGHRHFSHSLVGVVVIGFLSRVVLDFVFSYVLLEIDSLVVWYAFMIGVVSHILTDLPTKAGVPLFWPILWKVGVPPFRFMRFESGKFMETFICFPAMLIGTGYLLYTHQDKVLTFLQQYLK